ncbi:MAG: hypothetical protein HYZ42_06820 [Bacteroidetes bacterium]|nr:hypothetical protein [Bacteroidota bacterium]
MATPKKMYKMEFELKLSATMLYSLLSTPSGLAEWFCNDVDIKNTEYVFKWTGETRSARVLKKVTNKCIRYQWTDSEKDEYFEFDIEKDEITGDIALIITDFSTDAELSENRQLWESQIHEMQANLGMA